MAKLLLLMVAAWLVYSILKRYAKTLDSGNSRPAGEEKMVKCAHCGVHLPQSESVRVAQTDYCTLAHAQLHSPDKAPDDQH
ncbi:MAG TPA: PP0621 family protein [Methylovorus sp.]|nr:PP0621 family protein [Methylovorus sp.]